MITPPHRRAPWHRAIVIGGGIGGLLAARVLAEHFSEVIVVERDALPGSANFRPGVPQARHVHNFLVRGKRLVEELFPGFESELHQEGALRFEWPADFLWLSPSGWGRRDRSGLVTVACSRELLEWSIRRRLTLWPNVRVLERSEVTGLKAIARSRTLTITGVLVRSRDLCQAAAAEQVVDANLIVDASGRESRSAEWLNSHGVPPPEVTITNSFSGYASRLYARSHDRSFDWVAFGVQSRPPHSARSGIINSIEGDRWLVTLGGAGHDYPPTDEPGFLSFARSLPTALFAQALESATPISPIFGYRKMENRWRHFERVRKWPDNFAVLGDAVCSFNPLYAQGMTVSACAALLLQQLLAQRAHRPELGLHGLSVEFQRSFARALRDPWLMATGEDFRHRATEGPRPVMARLGHAYLDRVIRVAATDRAVNLRFFEVMHMLRSPLSLASLSMLAQVSGPAGVAVRRNLPG